jgi:tRNA uridine 5-carbamoylmethylation protein Kti12
MDGVLITGVYGSGKSSVAAEIAETLEQRSISYAAIDLDWLTWFHVPGLAPDAARAVYLDNVATIVHNVRDVGVGHLVLAVTISNRDEVRALEIAADADLSVVRLVVSPEEIVRRLQSDPTSGRHDDLAVAVQWLADSVGVGVEDLTVRNDGSVQDNACQIIDWLSWTS